MARVFTPVGVVDDEEYASSLVFYDGRPAGGRSSPLPPAPVATAVAAQRAGPTRRRL
jgi:hypothetical protein